MEKTLRGLKLKAMNREDVKDKLRSTIAELVAF